MQPRPLHVREAVFVHDAWFLLHKWLLVEFRLSPPIYTVNQLNPYPTKPRLTFSPSATFKLTIFSDLHYGENPWEEWGPQQDVNSARLMRTVLADEMPDYVFVWSYTSRGHCWRISCQASWMGIWLPEKVCSIILQRLLVSDTDIIFLDTFRENSTSLIDEIVAPLNEARIPFSSAYGVYQENSVNFYIKGLTIFLF